MRYIEKNSMTSSRFEPASSNLMNIYWTVNTTNKAVEMILEASKEKKLYQRWRMLCMVSVSFEFFVLLSIYLLGNNAV
jgi:hypothetical protein